MYPTIALFYKQCGTYVLTKDSTQYDHGALQPLLALPAQFHYCTFDFFTDLPPAWGFNCVLTVIDHLTNFVCLIPCAIKEDKLSAAQVTKLVFENIVGFIAVPKELVYNSYPRLLLNFSVNFVIFLA